MFKSDIKCTYKDFLFSLCGLLLVSAGGESAVLRFLGVLVFILFTAKLLNTLLYSSVFGLGGRLLVNASRKTFLTGKLLTLLCYSVISSAFLVVCSLLSGEESAIGQDIVPYMAFKSGAVDWPASIIAFASSVVTLLVTCSLLFLVMLICNLRTPGEAANRAWTYFVVLYLLVFPIGYGILVKLAEKVFGVLLVGGLLTLAVNLLFFVGCLAAISVVLGRRYKLR